MTENTTVDTQWWVGTHKTADNLWKSLDPDQDWKNVGPDLAPTLWHNDNFPERIFRKKFFWKKSAEEN